jgi:A/G-specific adenine glycosylase
MNIQEFRTLIWDYYTQSGRRDLPWRNTNLFYHILVSELMLQQTQVQRVIPKYQAWIERFPTFNSLAQAEFSEMLLYWQGLGYQRRAKYLYQIATILQHKTNRECQEMTVEELDALPGVGPYSARAIHTFATDRKNVFIETNIRTVFLYHFFSETEKVSDIELLRYIEQSLPDKNFRDWYYALMDYGSYLKSIGVKNTSQSTQYRKQSKFIGSNRQVRGKILSYLLTHKTATEREICTKLNLDIVLYRTAVMQLEKEGFVAFDGKRISIRTKLDMQILQTK